MERIGNNADFLKTDIEIGAITFFDYITEVPRPKICKMLITSPFSARKTG